jgi:hypothetical protein
LQSKIYFHLRVFASWLLTRFTTTVLPPHPGLVNFSITQPTAQAVGYFLPRRRRSGANQLDPQPQKCTKSSKESIIL